MKSDNRKPTHVFISYVRNNKRLVKRLCDDLTKQGVKVWLDRRDIKPGTRWQDAVEEAIKEGAFFIACFSKQYNERDETYMNEELTLAIDRLRKLSPDRIWFIPVKLNRCEVPKCRISDVEKLTDFQWVELYRDWDGGVQRIIDVIQPTPAYVKGAYARKLAETLTDEYWRVRASAATELGKIGDSATVPALIDALSDEDARVRQSAASALGYIGDPTPIPALTQALKDEYWLVGKYAADALRKIGTPEALKAVEEYGKRTKGEKS